MYPTLYHAIADLFGIEIHFLKVVQSFGFFVALAFLIGSYFFAMEMKRKEALGLLHSSSTKILVGQKASIADLILSGLLGFALGYKILYIALDFTAFTNDTQGFLLSMKGNFIGGIAGAAIAAYLKYREKEKEKLPEPQWKDQVMRPHEHVGNMTLIAAISGILGAKIFHNLENIDDFMADPVDALLSFSGLTMYGGLIFGSIAVLMYARKHKLNLLHVTDACAPALMLSYAIGRIGCQVSGDGDWGIVNSAPKPSWLSFLPDWMWSFNFHNNVNKVCNPYQEQTQQWLDCNCNWKETPYLIENVYPTPFYEVIMCTLLFFVLWNLRKRIHAAGVLFCTYLLLNGIERFLIEQIRVNTKYHIFGNEITQAQIISSILILLGIIGIWWFNKKHKSTNSTLTS